MASFSELTPARKVIVVLILAGSVASLWWSVALLWPVRQQAMSPEAFQEVFRESERIDRENWEKMWRDAGRKAPPPPPSMPDHP